MDKKAFEKYANLLVKYCLNVKKNEHILIKSSLLSEPLLQALYAEIIKNGAYCTCDLSFENQEKLFYKNANNEQLKHIPPLYHYAMTHFDAVIHIRAPYDVYSLKDIPEHKKTQRTEAMSAIKKIVMERSLEKKFRWVLCEFPTPNAAKSTGMSLKNYDQFIADACFISKEDPIKEWKKLSKMQEKIIKRLNSHSEFRFVTKNTDISFSTKGRTWINSDGKRNMPSGEVFTSPVENSVNGQIYFSFPTRYQGKDVSGVTLTVKNGYVTSWTAKKGLDVLDHVFKIKGSRYFGEVAIGTNPYIQKATKNILFDEKIGGSIHMAIGSSYPETGGKNESALHWDFITDMKKNGKIYADDTLIYQSGAFL